MAGEEANISKDVPIFLRKTYHLINTCDQDIACWSEDGETFVVKDPQRFQDDCIPTYFKHAKFSSFVRQLNFYSFRKIKYMDSIRIDPKLEAETSNYWRFRHENFRRGHPELLTEIKRMNGAKGASNKQVASSTAATAVDKESKSEVQTLKKKIEAMSKNIDELTAMVQKVSLKQDEQEKFADEAKELGAKRKRVDPSVTYDENDPRPDEMLSVDHPDGLISAMELEEVMPLSMPSPVASKRETSDSTLPMNDNEFVDELFSAFGNDEDGLLADVAPLESTQATNEPSNRPDPELMHRLGEALALLPRDIQELIVDRLIAAITSTDSLNESKEVSAELSKVGTSKIAASEEVSAEMPKKAAEEKSQDGSFPLAAATLAALLRHYSTQVKRKSHKSVQKTIPVIPVHA